MIKSITILFIELMAVFSLSAQTKHAVVIGIGKYQDSAWNVIHGDKDVPVVKRMLVNSGFSDITTLTNSEATKAGISSAFQSLLNRCRKNDIVYIHFSGHGQRMTDVNGDEDDGWDESWIPYDACLSYCNRDRGEKHLSDDEVGAWMTEIRKKIGIKGQIVLVVDACHSGDSSRNLDDVCVRGVEKNFILPHSDKRKVGKIKEDWLTVSACKNYQQNCEIITKNGNYGMLTYALYQLRNGLRDEDNSTLMKHLEIFVDNHRGSLPQTPVLTGNINRYAVRDVFK